jgi:transcriptional regulator with XRE-family HTH domain
MSSSDSFAAMIAGLEATGVSRAEIATRAGVSRATVWRLANGICADHLSSTVQRIEQLQRSLENNSPVKQERY